MASLTEDVTVNLVHYDDGLMAQISMTGYYQMRNTYDVQAVVTSGDTVTEFVGVSSAIHQLPVCRFVLRPMIDPESTAVVLA